MTSPTDSAGAALRLEGLAKTYGSDTVLDDVSLQVESGAFVTLLGPSGSGKTTTLNLIAGFDRPSRGTILLDGQDITGLPAHQRDIGVVFQNYALFPHMTVEQNIAFPLKQRKVRKVAIRSRVSQMLELVDLGRFAHRHPSELSGGQRQRVALARALVFNPRLLLLDEPLAALDRQLRASLQYELRNIHREVGITFVCVTHDQEEAFVLSDKIALYNDGRVQQFGAPQELYREPANQFVARFLGSANILPLRIEQSGSARIAEGEIRLDRRVGPDLRPGAEYSLMVRAEHLKTVAQDDNADTNTIQATVNNATFLGTTVRIEVRTEHGTQLVTHCSPGGRAAPAPGETVLLNWHPSDGVVLES